MMNKEICLTALSKLRRLEYEENQCDEYSTVINQLIHEHFYNPPLKFEELDEEMWIWDKKEKKYIRSINNYDSKIYGKGLRVEIGFDLVRYPFEPNRFYRKQVEE